MLQKVLKLKDAREKFEASSRSEQLLIYLSLFA